MGVETRHSHATAGTRQEDVAKTRLSALLLLDTLIGLERPLGAERPEIRATPLPVGKRELYRGRMSIWGKYCGWRTRRRRMPGRSQGANLPMGNLVMTKKLLSKHLFML